jgi:precorrin-4/cobalt-precorrin-4 C11-methyltransferase
MQRDNGPKRQDDFSDRKSAVAIGIGCKRGCSSEEIVALVERAIAAAPCEGAPTTLFTHEAKRSEVGLASAAKALRLPLVFLDGQVLRQASLRAATNSPRVMAMFGLPSIAEAAALADGAFVRSTRRAHERCGRKLCDRRQERAMTVHFIGAGPGAHDLITLRGRDLIARSPVCLFAGSLVPRALLEHCPTGARIVDTAPMSLNEISGEFLRAHDAGEDVARLHSGDLSIWSALGEQIRALDRLSIPYTITPGVPAFAAAAAAMGVELTLPEVAQSLVLTRVQGRASPMPEHEQLATFAATRTTLAIHLSIHAIERIAAELMPHYGADCPVAIVSRASWPDQTILRGTLATIAGMVAETPMERTALILIGQVLARGDFRPSALYDKDYQRRFRGRPQ